MTQQVSRKLSRRILFQRLYSECFIHNTEELFLESFFEGKFSNEIDYAYVNEMFDIILKHESKLLYVIKKFAPKFEVESMHVSYVLPIFIGASEMLYLKEELPAKVSINEGIELAKIFGDDSSKKIVNGVLNNVLTHIDTLKNELDDPEKSYTQFSFFAS